MPLGVELTFRLTKSPEAFTFDKARGQRPVGGRIEQTFHMLCENCQLYPATVHLTSFQDGRQTTVNVCEICASAKGLNEPRSAPARDLFRDRLTQAPAALAERVRLRFIDTRSGHSHPSL